MRLKTLSYTSRARLDLSDRDLSDIHQSARHLNALDGITGLLVFDDVRFFQIIEGSDGAIDHLLERLRRDERHRSFEIHDERFVDERSFPDWSMNLIRVSASCGDARQEIEPQLPANTSQAVRGLLFGMINEVTAQH